MSLPVQHEPNTAFTSRPIGELYRGDDTEMYIDLPAEIVDRPTPIEQGDGTVEKMQRTRSFRAFYRATEQLEALAAKPTLDPEGLSTLVGSQLLLTFAQQAAETDRKVTPELHMRIQLSHALASVKAYSGAIFETRDEPRMMEAYEKLFFENTYEDLASVGYAIVQKDREPKTLKQARAYNGFAHEVAFHLIHYRRKSALRFTTPASVRNDYFRPGERFDATAFNLKLGRERRVDVQIKSQASPSPVTHTDNFRMIYGHEDLYNVASHPFWSNSPLGNESFPTLMALLDEAAGDTSSSAQLDAVANRLHDRLFS